MGMAMRVFQSDSLRLAYAPNTEMQFKYGLAIGADTAMLGGGMLFSKTRYGKAILAAGAVGRLALDLWQPNEK